jgi:hypothetical protein
VQIQTEALESQESGVLADKVKELSEKLGVPSESGDEKLESKEAIAQVMVERAIKAGKT